MRSVFASRTGRKGTAESFADALGPALDSHRGLRNRNGTNRGVCAAYSAYPSNR